MDQGTSSCLMLAFLLEQVGAIFLTFSETNLTGILPGIVFGSPTVVLASSVWLHINVPLTLGISEKERVYDAQNLN